MLLYSWRLKCIVYNLRVYKAKLQQRMLPSSLKRVLVTPFSILWPRSCPQNFAWMFCVVEVENFSKGRVRLFCRPVVRLWVMWHSILLPFGNGFTYFRPSELVQGSNIDACGFCSGELLTKIRHLTPTYNYLWCFVATAL